ncbi:MAG: hypothetical protein V3W34_15405 [Phycisphaerae bacterium]
MQRRYCLAAATLLAVGSVARAGALIELVPATPGPYTPGQGVTVDIVITTDETEDVLLRLIHLDFRGTSSAIAAGMSFSIPPEFFEFPDLPRPAEFWTNAPPVLSAGVPTVLGQVGVSVNDCGVLDVMNFDEPDPDLGARIEVGTCAEGPPTAWRAFTGELVGGTLFLPTIGTPDYNNNTVGDGCDIAGGISQDCNTNNIPDECDIADGTADDVNGDGIPDECQDCNKNGVLDPEDIADGTSDDVNGDGIPDECQDCNNNGVLDPEDIANGTSEDCTNNGIPDECEPDCNGNAVADSCDILAGTSQDCNNNGIPDECDIASGFSQDCQANGIPDECDIFAGTSADCNANLVPDECEPDCQPNGSPDSCDIAAGTSADCNSNGIPDECDIAGGILPDCNNNGIADACDIADGTSQDCQPNGIPDECDVDPSDPDENGLVSPDCNDNGVPDECDIASGTSADCNGNGKPDECDIANRTSLDCQPNTVPDECDIATGTSADCNGNTKPDECDIANRTSLDCQPNGKPDECDIASGTSLDEDPHNGTPDECDQDCNDNGVPDFFDIFLGSSEDCNGNRIPDECDIADGTSVDENGDGIPDECQDCNDNGVLDPEDIANGTSQDCNGNGVPDECDIAYLRSQDCQPNGVPDECDIADGTSQDCQPNGVPDECDIADGTSEDCEGNGRPDECDIADGALDCQPNGIQDECELWACCFPEDEACIDTSSTECFLAGGIFLGFECLMCPEQNAETIDEPGGEIFIHRIGPPVECPTGEAGSRSTGPCPPGQFIDAWVSPEDGVMCHTFGVTGSPPIPADFFAPGSDPFSGSVCLRGVPLGPTPPYGDFGEADTLILRTTDPFDRCGLPPGAETTIPIEIVALSLEAVGPITVTFNGGQNPEQWDVTVDRSGVAPPPGTLSATKTHCNGGTYTSTLDVLPRFTFTKVGDPGEMRVLDTGLEGLDPVPLVQSVPNAWVHDVDPPFDANIDLCSTFHAGFQEIAPITACDCNGNLTRDKCEIEQGTSQDCNQNAVPDECDIDTGAAQDCQPNGIPDECELTGNDCQPNNIPDDCEVPPLCPACPDCQPNGIPDECELAGNDCQPNSIPDECEPDCQPNGIADDCDIRDCPGDPACSDCDGNGVPDGCDPEVCLPPTVTGGIASRYIQIEPDLCDPQPVALMVTNLCTGAVGWVRRHLVDYDDGPQGPVNVGVVEASCMSTEFYSPADWIGTGAKLVVTGHIPAGRGDLIAPNTDFSVEAVCGGCASPLFSPPAVTTMRTWKYGDCSGDGQVTFFADLFKIFSNTAASGFPFWLGLDPGYEVDPQDNALPDQQSTFFTDIFPAFQATVAAGCTGFWAGTTCCAVVPDCHPCETGCDGGACNPPPLAAK